MLTTRILITQSQQDSSASLKDSLISLDASLHIDWALNTAQAVNLLSLAAYDILICDLPLSNPETRDFIDRARALSPSGLTGVIILSDSPADNPVLHAASLGASCYLTKPVSPSIIHCCIDNMLISRYETHRHADDMDRRIADMLLSCGITPHIKGYGYIREAIRIIHDASPRRTLKITRELYPMIAEIYDTTPSRVERAIRHAIEKCWALGVEEDIRELFGKSIYRRTVHPTNGEFLTVLAERLSLDYSETSRRSRPSGGNEGGALKPLR